MKRRTVLGFLFCCLLPSAGWAASPEIAPLDDDDVAVVYAEETYTGKLSIEVPVPPGVAWEVLTDFNHMADFIPDLDSSRETSRENGVVYIAQRGKAGFGPFSFRFESERRVEMRPDGRLISQAISGSTKKMVSETRIQKSATGTRIDYSLEMIPDRWMPSSLGVNFLRRQLAEQFTALMREMVRRNSQRDKARPTAPITNGNRR